jgi:exodeoxyribonuclease VII large subunit
MGVLEGSGFAFRVTHARTAVQGADAAYDVAMAIATLGSSGCDVVCVVRGGGSQADLSAFDHEAVARAIAGSPVPVRTGIGHTGDVSVADLVAHEACRTPTACAEGLVTAVRDWYALNVATPAERVREAAVAVLDELADAQDQVRRHLAVVGRHRVVRAEDSLLTVAAATARHAARALDGAGASVARRARRLGPVSTARLAGASQALAARRALLVAYDPGRLLGRGWSITTDDTGRVVRTVRALDVGSSLVTRLADGVARSSVTAVEPTPKEEGP